MGTARQFLYMSAEGYAATAGLDDLTTLSKLVINTGGVAGVGIDMTSTKISNLADPVASTDAANKAYVDYVAQLNSFDESPVVKSVWTAAGAVAKGAGVYISANNSVSTGINNVDASSRVIGVAELAIAAGATGKIVHHGAAVGVLSGASANTRYFMGRDGLPTIVGSLSSGDRTIQLGISKNATDLFVSIIDYGKRA